MRYFKDTSGSVWGFDQSQQSLIAGALAKGWVDVTDSWPPKQTDAQLAEVVRLQRDSKLSDCDWVVIQYQDQQAMVAAKIAVTPKFTDAQYAEVLQYRQYLRDVPTQTGFPTDVSWPVAPEWVSAN